MSQSIVKQMKAQIVFTWFFLVPKETCKLLRDILLTYEIW